MEGFRSNLGRTGHTLGLKITKLFGKTPYRETSRHIKRIVGVRSHVDTSLQSIVEIQNG